MKFEKTYQIDPERENRQSIEMSDEEYIKMIDLKSSTPPAIPMKLEMPILEKTIQRGENAKSKSESTQKKSKKISTKSHKTAVARVQKKLL